MKSPTWRAIRFYTETLGLKLLLSKVDSAHHEAFAFLELEGGNLELLQKLDENDQPIPRIAPDPVTPYCPHLALRAYPSNQAERAARCLRADQEARRQACPK